ncbi:uncharacterized protein BDR25DRAFT_324091 [Lindgomyces ingoldianus]|uniref:Uncharacterized protein n=1 Tax=Lindgomyces ingoldianus TaxID=673940 RepID=A0ACB6R0F7_9PLEO|nr:uncharacterized protein BDR25DRAFT_324091 [Lindgomyces ingoldianus]KAF2472758.1 hypothetical protein BDR25DRAFT_324091 [Lindgomyces ingoldianus]
MATRSDVQVAALAAGFTIGFGFLTVWEAIRQTQRNRNPLRSVYIYMVWGEIAANLAIGIVGWVFLDGVIGPTIPVLFFILFLWVFEIQLLMQIIINRIALIAEHQSTIRKIKWGTVAIISAINIAVFCIWIPSHLNPPVSQLVINQVSYVDINKYWDRASKIIIMVVDGLLNYYFLRTVKIRLVKQHGLVKYKPLVGFNAKLMVVSIAMDAMLIGLMSLPNQVVYIQFHPVAYMVKLNIEMSMASLVVRLAKGKTENDMYEVHSYPDPHSQHRSIQRNTHLPADPHFNSFPLASTATSRKGYHNDSSIDGKYGIHCRTDLNIVVEDVTERGQQGIGGSRGDIYGDETPLNKSVCRVIERPL